MCWIASSPAWPAEFLYGILSAAGMLGHGPGSGGGTRSHRICVYNAWSENALCRSSSQQRRVGPRAGETRLSLYPRRALSAYGTHASFLSFSRAGLTSAICQFAFLLNTLYTLL